MAALVQESRPPLPPPLFETTLAPDFCNRPLRISQCAPRPEEFRSKNCEARSNNEHSRAWQYQQYDADEEDSAPHDSYE
jgi:hypothetical protein